MGDFKYNVELFFDAKMGAMDANQNIQDGFSIASSISQNPILEDYSFSNSQNLSGASSLLEKINYTILNLQSILDKAENMLSDVDKEIMAQLEIQYMEGILSEAKYDEAIDSYSKIQFQLEGELKELNDIYNHFLMYTSLTYGGTESEKQAIWRNVVDKTGTDYKSLDDLLKRISEVKTDLAVCGTEIKWLKQQKILRRCEVIERTDKFKNFEYTEIYQREVDFNDYDPDLQSRLQEINELIDEGYFSLTQEEKKMYHFLLENYNDEAKVYLSIIADENNRRLGKERAKEFLESIESNDSDDFIDSVSKTSKSLAKGCSDGFESFFEGISNNLTHSSVLSADQYEMLYILDQIDDYDHSFSYNFGVGAGNVAPVAIVSLVTSSVATPAAGANVGIALTAASASGATKKNILASGSSEIEAVEMQLYKFLSTATLAKTFSNLPYLSKAPDVSILGFSKEGLRGVADVTIDKVGRSIIIDENIDIAELGKESRESFVKYIFASAVINGLAIGGEKTFNTIKYKWKGNSYEVSLDKISSEASKLKSDNDGVHLIEEITEDSGVLINNKDITSLKNRTPISESTIGENNNVTPTNISEPTVGGNSSVTSPGNSTPISESTIGENNNVTPTNISEPTVGGSDGLGKGVKNIGIGGVKKAVTEQSEEDTTDSQ